MELKLETLRKKDYKKAIRFAIKGMNFNWYMQSRLLLNLYGRYFLYLELSRATHVIAAYYGGELAGLLLCGMRGKKGQYGSFWQKFYVGFFDFLQKTFVKEGVGPYDRANKEMFAKYCETHSPDGEIVFLAANPDIQIKGVGTFLLQELERRERGKEVCLYTDSGCTYQFYEHRGFERVQERPVVIKIGNTETKIQCFLYRKTLG